MNIHKIVVLTSDALKNLIPRDSKIFNFYNECIYFVSRLFYSTLTLLLYCLKSFAYEITSVFLTLLSFVLILLFLSFIKSIQPRYRLSGEDDQLDSSLKPPKSLNQSLQKEVPENVHSSNKTVQNFNSGHETADKQNKSSLLINLVEKFSRESIQANQLCHPALTNVDIQSIQHQMSWSYSQPDMESLNWFNQTLRTFWPSIRTLLYKFCLIELARPRDDVSFPPTIKKGQLGDTTEQSKMSVFISSRRKLDFIRKVGTLQDLSENENLFKRSALKLIAYVVKLILIYLKQFVMDNIAFAFKQQARNAEAANNQKLEFDFKSLISHISSKQTAASKKADVKSWAGFNLKSRGRDEQVKLRRKSKSASNETMRKRVLYKSMTTLVRPTNSSKNWARHRKLIKKFLLARKKMKKRGVLIDRIRLGDSNPTINAIKYLDGKNDFVTEPYHKLFHSLTSDDQNMRFMIEVSYESDKNFEIHLSSMPVLGRARVVDVRIQLRFLVTLNHTITKLNSEPLELFETPDDVLFPAINYIQLTLVDVPKLNWYIVRPSKNPNSLKNLANFSQKSNLKSVVDQINQYLDPIYLLNHKYFKFILHSVIYLALKWFQPFEIKINQSFYVKTTC